MAFDDEKSAVAARAPQILRIQRDMVTVSDFGEGATDREQAARRMVYMTSVQVVLDNLKQQPLKTRAASAVAMLRDMLEEDIKTWSVGHNSLNKRDYLLLEQEIRKAEETLDLVKVRLAELKQLERKCGEPATPSGATLSVR